MSWPIELSRQYASQSSGADIFGVIVFTDLDVALKKMISDDDYWKALGEESGPRWVVFATRAKLKDPPFIIKLLAIVGGALIVKDVEFDPKANKELIEVFELGSARELPVVVCFQEARDGTILRCSARIEGDTPEEAFLSVRDIFRAVAASLDRHSYERLSSSRSEFEAVERAVGTHNMWRGARKGLKLWQWLMSMK